MFLHPTLLFCTVVITYKFFFISCDVVCCYKRFGWPAFLHSWYCMLWSLQQQTNLQTTAVSLEPKLADKRLFGFDTRQYNCACPLPGLKWSHTWYKSGNMAKHALVCSSQAWSYHNALRTMHDCIRLPNWTYFGQKISGQITHSLVIWFGLTVP